jgi:hypothetical protein
VTLLELGAYNGCFPSKCFCLSLQPAEIRARDVPPVTRPAAGPRLGFSYKPLRGRSAMPIDYGDRVPMLERFKHDSSVPMAIRTKDTVLTAIDARLAEYEKRPLNRFEVMVDLFLSINLWIKCYHQQQPGFLKGRYPAIAALNEVVIHTLMQLTGAATPGHVMREIQAIIGLNINDSGKQTDKTMYAVSTMPPSGKRPVSILRAEPHSVT